MMRPKKAANKAAVSRILDALTALYPAPVCALHFSNPLQLLVATMLSAQCTDKRVNLVTPALFAAFPDADAMSQASQGAMEELVRTTGFFRNKAKNVIAMAQMLMAHHEGQVPQTLAELVALPGVARKTANVVLGVGFGLCEGVVVDTHVMRLSQRLGLALGDNPTTIEKELMACLPKARWVSFSHQLIEHGRAVCVARTPRCSVCTLAKLCPSAQGKP